MWLAGEIGWIKDQRLPRREDHLAAERTGRGIALTETRRAEIRRLFEIYQHHFRDHGLTDWHNIALRFHDAAVVAKSPGFPQYDAVFVDEAQFFAKSWFEIVGAALKPGGHLFLAADPTQEFLRRQAIMACRRHRGSRPHHPPRPAVSQHPRHPSFREGVLRITPPS